ncbi:MAG: hypothetical protein CSA95_01075 [Bacteroidetes bacterium]|nr:MAG: hypothetical protein CSA95_01075 [Bacteroidota bacterium]
MISICENLMIASYCLQLLSSLKYHRTYGPSHTEKFAKLQERRNIYNSFLQGVFTLGKNNADSIDVQKSCLFRLHFYFYFISLRKSQNNKQQALIAVLI